MKRTSTAIERAHAFAGRLAEQAADRDRERRFPHGEIDEMRATGLLALRVPSQHGGAGGSIADVVRVVTALAQADASVAQIYITHEQGSTAELYRLIHPVQLASDLTEELRSTIAPMMVTVGDTGPMGKHSGYAKGYDSMKKLRPDLELAVVEGATGTYSMIEDPEQSAARAIEFLERHPLSSPA